MTTIVKRIEETRRIEKNSQTTSLTVGTEHKDLGKGIR